MPKNIWGISPISGKAECFALRFPESEIPELVKEAERIGWTQVTIGNWDPTPGEDDATVQHEPVTED